MTRRLRARLGGDGIHATHNQVVAAQRNITAAIALLDWLIARDLILATARQGDLETWLASEQATHRTDAGNFVRWARRHKLTSLDFAAIRRGGPTGVIDTETRWEQARWLLHDSTLKSGRSRSAALFQLATDLPAAVLARMLGIHIAVAVAWQRASSGEWTRYAADVARRTTTEDQ